MHRTVLLWTLEEYQLRYVVRYQYNCQWRLCRHGTQLKKKNIQYTVLVAVLALVFGDAESASSVCVQLSTVNNDYHETEKLSYEKNR